METNHPSIALDWTNHKTIRLETRKRDGTWVATPVSLVTRGDRLFFRTYKQSGKAKRLRNFADVRAAPCTFLGKPTGHAVSGSARLLDEGESVTTRRTPAPAASGAAWCAGSARSPGDAIRHSALRADSCRSRVTVPPGPECSTWRGSCSGCRGIRLRPSRRSRKRRACHPGPGASTGISRASGRCSRRV